MLASRRHGILKYSYNSLWNVSVRLADLWRVQDRLPRQGILNPSPAHQTSGKLLMLSSSQEFAGETANLSSTGVVAAVTPTDTFTKDDDSAPDYDKALFLLKNNPPEQRLDIYLPYSEYRALEETWSKFKSQNNIQEEKRYPSLSYNSLMQIATVVATQSALHDCTGAVFREIIASSVKEYLSIPKPNAIRRIADSESTTMRELKADESFLYGRPGESPPRLQVVIECRVGENYKALCRDKDLWIQHLGAKAVVIICFKEAPQFKTAGTALENINDVVTEVKIMEQHAARAMARSLEEGRYGPIEYRNHTWVGEVNELFVEVWRANGRPPVRKCQALQMPVFCAAYESQEELALHEYLQSPRDWASPIVRPTSTLTIALYHHLPVENYLLLC
ncbi:hypothetical protein V1515DRAFT_617719 [Lipomyces mesembrius]